MKLSDVDGNVDFENIYFSYTADKKLIENLNLKVTENNPVSISAPLKATAA